MLVTQTLPPGIHQSRFGFHPCSREDCRKLKRLNALYLRAVRQYKTHLRWRNKAPHNRVIKQAILSARGEKIDTKVIGPWLEPPLPAVFAEKKTVRDAFESYMQKKDVDREIVEFSRIPIIETYYHARRPAATPQEVRPMKISMKEVDAWLQKLAIVQKTPGVCGGDACIRDTRIAVWILVNDSKLGMTDGQILDDYLELTQFDLDAAWKYYQDNQAEIDEAIVFNEED